MNRKISKHLIGLLCAILAMFVWIFVAVGLTGGREAADFTDRDKTIMTVFVIVEVATAIVMLIFAVLLGREWGMNYRNQVYTAAAYQDKITQRRSWFLSALAYITALGAMIGGIVLRKELSAQLLDLSGWLLGISIALAVIFLLLNILLKQWYEQRFEKQQVGQAQQFVYSHRKHAEETAAKKLSLVRRWRLFTAGYGVLLGILGLCIGLCSGIGYEGGSGVSLCFIAALLIMCSFSRIQFSVPKNIFYENETYVSEKQYPRLYAMAQKAAQTIGCSGTIRVALLPDCNAGIAKIGNVYSLQLGAVLLSILSEEELYSVMLHEFAHVTTNTEKTRKEGNYYQWIRSGKIPHFASGITNLFFSFLDTFYRFQFSLYAYAASIQIETAADQAMLQCGNPAAVASGLLKIRYYELFEWEKGTRDVPCMYEPERPDKQLLTQELARFREVMQESSEKWNQLIKQEIQSRAASHPTVKQRLAALGIEEYRIIEAESDKDFAKECDKAKEYVESLICRNMKKEYEMQRKALYLEPKAQVEKWENDGKPLVAQEYGDIVWALCQLGRNTEAMKLCEHAIAELPAAASCYGYFMRGCYRLHSYDESGIKDIYFALENNSNYLEEGIDVIGNFCCLTGNQKELDIYRQKAVELAQKHKDQYSQLDVLTKKDRLSEESLPDGMLDDILEYIRSIDNGQIEKIYLVRKTITEDFFTSVFVIRFDLEAEEAFCDEMMHKIFQYLDTCSDWQFSLFNFQDVMRVPVYEIKNSCVYSKDNS